jgi:hypothetical protein
VSVLEMPTPATRERLNAEVDEARDALGEVATNPATPADRDSFREARWTAYRDFRASVRRIAGAPEWRDNPVAQELLDQTLELEERIEQDAAGTDPQWRIREVADHISDLISTLLRELDHNALDDPPIAARFVVDELSGIDQAELGRLLAVDPRTIREWKASRPKTIRKNPDRITLIAQLVYDLRSGMTSRGIINWFGRSRPQLNGESPLDVLAHDDIGLAAGLLRPLARGARGQLGT